MTITTDTRPETAQAQSRAMFDYKRLIAAHRNQKNYAWKWARASKIEAEYQITEEELERFHKAYGLPRLNSTGKDEPVYSLPALEVILETVPQLQDEPK